MHTYEWAECEEELTRSSSAVILPEYSMAYNHSPDGLTGWTDEDVSGWLHSVRMDCEALPVEWFRDIIEPNGSPSDVGPFALMGSWYYFYKTGRQRVCEWRPGCYATAGVLSDWGPPITCYGVLRTHIQQMLAPQVMLYDKRRYIPVNRTNKFTDGNRGPETRCKLVMPKIYHHDNPRMDTGPKPT